MKREGVGRTVVLLGHQLDARIVETTDILHGSVRGAAVLDNEFPIGIILGENAADGALDVRHAVPDEHDHGNQRRLFCCYGSRELFRIRKDHSPDRFAAPFGAASRNNAIFHN